MAALRNLFTFLSYSQHTLPYILIFLDNSVQGGKAQWGYPYVKHQPKGNTRGGHSQGSLRP